MENVQAVLDKAQVFDVIFELIYFNSSSAMFLFDLFNMLDDAAWVMVVKLQLNGVMRQTMTLWRRLVPTLRTHSNM